MFQAKNAFQKAVVMFHQCSKMVLAACLAFFVSLNISILWAQTGSASIEMALTLTWGVKDKQEIPYFNITITNVSIERISVVDIRNRLDFIDSFLDVEIVPTDNSFELSRMISDPNTVTDADFVELDPGEVLEFKLIELPIDYSELVPGKYVAQGKYRIDPVRRPFEIYKSNELIFEMK